MAEKHPELVVTFMKGMIKVGRLANEHKHAARGQGLRMRSEFHITKGEKL